MAANEILSRPTLGERGWLLNQLRDETVGGAILLCAAALALIWANSPWGDSYTDMVAFKVGPESLGLNLPLGIWAADALLAIFFFVVGLELKHELVLGSLSKPAQAIVPAAAAIGGMVVPALIFVVVNANMDGGSLRGWGIPMATDIAFALAVLAMFGRRLPVALRAFLLTLAVVDDLGAITVIAIFYSDKFAAIWFGLFILTLVAYWLLQKYRITSPFLYIPLVIIGWYFCYKSGIHATVAGVIFGFLTRVRPDPGEIEAPADRLIHRIHPISAGFAVPVFALMAAGVDLRSTGLVDALSSPLSLGIILGLVVGKPVGILTMAWFMARFTRASLAPGIVWRDIFAVGLLAGVGFTVALLITELGYQDNSDLMDSAKIAVLVASVIAAAIAAVALLSRGRAYAAIAKVEEADLDKDGIPDVYQQGDEIDTPGNR
jgi:NhaA family Na+:H+ antiporter